MQTAPNSTVRLRRMSIKVKFLLAIGGLCLFVLPLSLLTLHYLSRGRNAAKEFRDHTQWHRTVRQARHDLTEKRTDHSSLSGTLKLLGTAPLLSPLHDAFKRYRDRISVEGKSELARQNALVSAEQTLRELEKRLAEQQSRVARVAGDANRLIVSLLLLLLLYVAFLVIAGPARLTQPLTRMAALLTQAKTGNLNFSAASVHTDEVGELEQLFNQMLATMARFDEKKKQQLILARNRLRVVSNRLGVPLVAIDHDGQIDFANRPFTERFGEVTAERRHVADFCAPLWEAIEAEVTDLLANTKTILEPMSLRTTDGSSLQTQPLVSVVRDQHGDPYELAVLLKAPTP